MGTAGQCPALFPLPFLFTLAISHSDPGFLSFSLCCAVETQYLSEYGDPLPYKHRFLSAIGAIVYQITPLSMVNVINLEEFEAPKFSSQMGQFPMPK